MFTFNLNETTNPKQLSTFFESEMDKHVKHFEKELAKIRTGRAHTSMIEDIKVSCYASLMPLKDVAALSAPDVNLLVIQPWDLSIINEVEKALATSDLGVTPQVDGNIIRIVLPRMSSSRREEFGKLISKRLEECKIALRNVRKEGINLIRDAEKTKKISEDLSKRFQDLLQKTTDKITETIEKLAQKKEEEIRLL